MRIFQKGFNFSQDGPGNRLVYHLSGCNMRCIWCSNPEGMAGDTGQEYTVEELLAEAISCRPMFFSGGGVTFTGGEATVQWMELSSLLLRLTQDGIHTAIETNGTSIHLAELQAHIDYLIMDFKHYDGAMLCRFTGMGNEQIKFNFENHCAIGRQQHIRIPLIHGFNDDNPRGFADYFSTYNCSNTVFEFLPYHEYGRDKWQSEYRVRDGFVTKETVARFTECFEKSGLTVIRT